MSADVESLIQHFASEKRKRGFQEAALSALLTQYPQVAREIKDHDTIDSITYNRRNFVVLSGNPVPDTRGETYVVQYRNVRREDYILFPAVPPPRPRRGGVSRPEDGE